MTEYTLHILERKILRIYGPIKEKGHGTSMLQHEYRNDL